MLQERLIKFSTGTSIEYCDSVLMKHGCSDLRRSITVDGNDEITELLIGERDEFIEVAKLRLLFNGVVREPLVEEELTKLSEIIRKVSNREHLFEWEIEAKNVLLTYMDELLGGIQEETLYMQSEDESVYVYCKPTEDGKTNFLVGSWVSDKKMEECYDISFYNTDTVQTKVLKLLSKYSGVFA